MEQSTTTYINVLPWMATELKLKPSEILIYAVIHGFSMNGYGYYFGTVKYMTELTNLSNRTVIDILTSLTERGLIIKEKTQNINLPKKEVITAGCCYYCLYYTAKSRNIQPIPIKNTSEKTSLDTSEKTSHNNLSNNINLNSTSQTTENKKEEAEDFIINTIKGLFFGHYAFDNSFATDIVTLVRQYRMTKEQVDGYIHYCFDISKSKHPSSLTNYFHKMILSENTVIDYIAQQDSKNTNNEKESKSITTCTCPVCGCSKVSPMGECPECQTSASNFNNEREIWIQKQIYNLPPAKKIAFKKDYVDYMGRRISGGLELAFNPMKIKQLENELNEIYQKHGISTELPQRKAQ